MVPSQHQVEDEVYAALGNMFDEDEEKLNLTRPSWVAEDGAADQPIKSSDQPPQKDEHDDGGAGEAAAKETPWRDTDTVGETDEVCGLLFSRLVFVIIFVVDFFFFFFPNIKKVLMYKHKA